MIKSIFIIISLSRTLMYPEGSGMFMGGIDGGVE